MFTTIRELRKSTAIQDRVDSVEKHLLRLNPDWKIDYWFPVIAIGLSNVNDDVDWVMGRGDLLLGHNTSGARVFVGDRYRQASSVLAVVRDISMDIPERGKTAFISEQLRQYNVALGNLYEYGGDYSWSLNPLMDSPYMMEAVIPHRASAGIVQVEDHTQAEKLILLEELARAAFIRLNNVKDWGMALSEFTPTGKFASERAETKFKGFLSAVEAFQENPNFLNGDNQ